MSLEENVRAAAAAGLSYGQYMATKPPSPTPEPKPEPERECLGHLTCVICGKEFPVYDKLHRKYCSEACKAEGNRKLGRAHEAKWRHHHMVSGGFAGTCAVCGKEFRAASRNRRYCSVECRQEAMRLRANEWNRENRKK